MTPFIRGRFIPEVESTGGIKGSLDVLLWLPELSLGELRHLDSIEILRTYLASMVPSRCSINLWVPTPFSETQTGLTAIGISFGLALIAAPTDRVREDLGAHASQEVLEIAATALSVDADVVVTSSPALLPYVIDLELCGTLLADFETLKRQCELFARGHEIPWTFEANPLSQPWNGFYNLYEPRTFVVGLRFLERAQAMNLTQKAQEVGRTLVHNRLPNLCFTRDRLLFYDAQRNVSRRQHWQRQEFLFESGYYLNFYYLLLYGGFDHLAVVTNETLQLGVPERKVGAIYPDFLNALRERSPAIHELFTEARVVEFVRRIGALRHYSAHRGSIAPGKIYEKLDPEPSEAELDAEIEAQGTGDFLIAVPEGPIRDTFRKTLRAKLLLSKSKLIAEGVVFVEIHGQWSYIFPMIDTEWNFVRYHQFMVSVLSALTNLM
jgi:hypothetical protein